MRNSRRIAIVITLILLSYGLFAQKDSSYVEQTLEPFTLGLNTTFRSNYFEIFDGNLQAFTLKRTDMLAGVRLRYKKLALVVSAPIKNLSTAGDFAPRSFGMAAKLELGKFFFSTRANYFSLTSLDKILESTKANNCASFNLFSAYVVEGDQISFGSNYTFVNPQKQTADSWFISSNINVLHSHFETDFLLSQSQNPHDVERYGEVRIMIGGGYTRSIVWNDWLFSYLINAGVEGSFSEVSTRDEDPREFFRLHRMPRISGSASMVRQWNDSIYSGIIAEWEPHLGEQRDWGANVSFFIIRFGVGKRF